MQKMRQGDSQKVTEKEKKLTKGVENKHSLVPSEMLDIQSLPFLPSFSGHSSVRFPWRVNRQFEGAQKQ